MVRIDEKQRSPRAQTNRLGNGSQCVWTREGGDEEIAARQATAGGVDLSFAERHVADPIAREFSRDGETRLNGPPACFERGKYRREPSRGRVCWAGDEEDPHGGDDGILA